MQRQHEEAENVFPEERRCKQITAEDFALPDRAGDHDRVKQQGLDHDRRRRDAKPLARGEITKHEHEADQEDRELDRREDPLHQRPLCCVAANALFGRVQQLKWLCGRSV